MNIRSRPTINSEYIYHDLLEKIIALEYKPGEGISENELCERYGTTRHNVRGALAVLKEKGLVEVIPQKGTYVSLIDLKMIDDILFLRSAVEQETLHTLFKKGIAPDLIEQLRTCLNKQLAVKHTRENAEEFYKLDDEFHQILMDAAGRGTVRHLYEDAYLHVRRWRNMEVGVQERITHLPEEHQKIIEAIERHNETEAHKCMVSHIDSVNLFGDELKSQYPQYFA